MKRSKRWLGLTATALAFSLVAAACGDSGGTTDAGGTTTAAPTTTAVSTPTTTAASGGTETTTTAAPTMSSTYDLGGGAVLDTTQCPGSWDSTQGITDSEIRIGISLPQSGALAGFGTIAEGMQIFFDNADPIDGKSVKIISRDDGYESGRTVTNIGEMIDTDNIFAFSHIIGSPNNLAVRDTLQEECIPQLFNSTGLPQWGDPENYPWTIGQLLNYSTESLIWCDYLSKELGPGGTVAAIYANNDFGKAYQKFFEKCAPEVGLEIVGTELHDPNADTVQNEVTTLAATGAQAFVVGTSGANCPRSVGGARAAGWDTLIMVSATCQNIGLFWKPLKGASNGIKVITTTKDIGDPRWADDPWVTKVRDELTAAGIDPDAGAQQTGYTFAEQLDHVLREAAASAEGLNRGSLMQATWQQDWVAQNMLPGSTVKTDGANDAYIVEAGEISELVWDDAAETGTWTAVSDLINQEGQLGKFAG